MIFNLSLGQRRFLNRAPHDRLRAAHEPSAHCDVEKLGDNLRLRFRAHRQIRIIPLRFDTQRTKLFCLHIDPAFSIFPAARAELSRADIFLGAPLAAKLFFNFPFNRQAVAIPAGHIRRIPAGHLVRAHDNVFDDFVHRRAEVNMPIGIRRAIMEQPWLCAARFGICAHLLIKLHLIPALDPFRLSLWQAAALGEFSVFG